MILPKFYLNNEFTRFFPLIEQGGGVRRQIPAGTLISEAHDKTILKCFYIISGVARFYVINEDGEECTIFFLGKGTIYPVNCYEEKQYMDDFLYLSAVTDLEVYAFPPRYILEMSKKDPGFTEAVIGYYVEYAAAFLFKSMLRTYNNSFLLISSFLYMYYYNKPEAGDFIYLTQEELGRITTLSRSQVARVIAVLQKDGVIEVRKGGMKILSLEELKRRSSGDYYIKE